MKYTIASRMSGMTPDAVAGLFKTLGNPNILSFAGGSPSPETFPIKEFSEISARLWADKPADFLRYGVAAGYEPLREILRERMGRKFGLVRENDEILITTGAQQCLDLVTKLFVNEGDTILCDNPCFAGTIGTFRSYGANVIGIPVDEQGMDLDALEAALNKYNNVKLIYTIPAYQNPMGVTMTLERRRRMHDILIKYDALLLEDSPYFELRYSGECLPHVKTFDDDGRVIFCGTLSKILAPGLRLGYLIFDRSLLTDFLNGKQSSDLHTPLYTQMLAAEFFKGYDVDAHIERACGVYRIQRDAMLAAIGKYFDPRVWHTNPDGGLFLYCRLPEGYSGARLCDMAAEKRVACVPGDAFDVDGRHDLPEFRLNFSLSTAEQIEKGMKILGDCTKEYLK